MVPTDDEVAATGEFAENPLSEELPKYGEAFIWAQKEFVSQGGVSDRIDVDGRDVLDDWSIGASAFIPVNESVEMEEIINLLEEEMYTQMRNDHWDVLKEIIQRKWGELGKIGLGATGFLSGTYIGLQYQTPGAFETAVVSFPWMISGAREIYDEFGPRNFYSGVEHFVDEREIPPSALYDEIVQDTLDNLYIIDIEYVEADLGEMDEIMEQYGTGEFEEHGISIDQDTYGEANKKLDSDLEDKKHFNIVWSPTDEKRYLKQVIGTSFDEQEFNHPSDLFASEYGHTPNGYS